MTLFSHLKNLAEQYAKYQPDAPDAASIEADLRDLYRNGNLSTVFPYLDDLDETTYGEETLLINELRPFLADILTN